jgi:hypothetical protein
MLIVIEMEIDVREQQLALCVREFQACNSLGCLEHLDRDAGRLLRLELGPQHAGQ